MVSAVQKFWQNADASPDQVALRIDDVTWTRGELRDRSARWAGHLANLGVGPGDRVLIGARTSADWITAYHGILALGALAVTVNEVSTEAEFEHFLSDSGARLALADSMSLGTISASADRLGVQVLDVASESVESAPALSPRPAEDRDGAVIMYTSGTTGQPKGAELTHIGLRGSAASVTEAINVTPDDRSAAALPLFHIFGQVTVLRTAFDVGAELTLLPRFDAEELLRITARHRISILSGVPTMWNAMANAGPEFDAADWSALRLAVSGGAGLPAAIQDRFWDRYGCELLPGYGLTETTGAGTCHRAGQPRKPGSSGIAWPGVELSILSPEHQHLPVGSTGEIAIRSAMVMNRYWNRPDATAESFHEDWFLTGDVGYMDHDGYLWIIDRIKEMIIRGGHNVYPREVEEVLHKHPDILEVTVLGIPDEHLGEEIAAVVSPRPGHQIDVNDVQEWLGERLTGYKTPRIYHVVDALPKGSTGKILKRAIDREEIRVKGTRTQRRARSASA